MGLLRALHDEGSTICMVTHDPRYSDYAKRTIHLFDGRLTNGAEAGVSPVGTSPHSGESQTA